jgi:signal transduction histidine kinase
VNQAGYAFLGLTAIMAVVVGATTFALFWLATAARNTRKHLRESGGDTSMLSAALQEAVTRLKAQEQATSARAAASEQLSSQIVESLTAGLLVVEQSGRVEILNPAGRRMLHVTHDPIGVDFRGVLRETPQLADVIGECLSLAQPIVRRAVQATGISRVAHFGVTVSPLTGPAGRAGVICLFSDLTNVIELEEQLRLKETLARLGELTAGIAHEFRNGLATIHGYSRLIDPAAVPAQYKPYVEGIRQEAEALGKVVTNFLNFSRPEQLALTAVDLQAIARRAADDLHHELPSGTTVTVTGAFAPIQGDEVLLRQVFSNLIRNAAEACESAGTVPAITIRGDVDPAARTCSVAVEDNGPGVRDEDRARIFQPFFTTRSRGTGLGLAIVQKIVVIHNGRVTARSSPAGGASMQMAFPLAAG